MGWAGGGTPVEFASCAERQTPSRNQIFPAGERYAGHRTFRVIQPTCGFATKVKPTGVDVDPRSAGDSPAIDGAPRASSVNPLISNLSSSRTDGAQRLTIRDLEDLASLCGGERIAEPSGRRRQPSPEIGAGLDSSRHVRTGSTQACCSERTSRRFALWGP